MSIFKDRKTYLKKINKFSSNPRMIEENFSSINVTKYMKSMKDESEQFTNFVKSQGTEKYKSMRNIYYLLQRNINTINREFVVNEIIQNGLLLKLKKLIFENTEMDLTIQEIVMNVRKFDYKNDSGIRLYFLKTKKDEMILILIDLYHLVFVSANRDIKTEYERRKKYSYNLNNIIF